MVHGIGPVFQFNIAVRKLQDSMLAWTHLFAALQNCMYFFAIGGVSLTPFDLLLPALRYGSLSGVSFTPLLRHSISRPRHASRSVVLLMIPHGSGRESPMGHIRNSYKPISEVNHRYAEVFAVALHNSSSHDPEVFHYRLRVTLHKQEAPWNRIDKLFSLKIGVICTCLWSWLSFDNVAYRTSSIALWVCFSSIYANRVTEVSCLGRILLSIDMIPVICRSMKAMPRMVSTARF